MKRMDTVNLDTIVGYYLADMQRRNCTDDSVTASRRSLSRFARWLPDGGGTALKGIETDTPNDYITHLQSKTQRYVDNPYKRVEEGKLSPFTIHKEAKTLRAFGSWLERENFCNPFCELEMPKTPQTLIEPLTDEEIEKIMSAINPATGIGARQYAIIMLLLDSGLRVNEAATAQIDDLDLDLRQLRVTGKGRKDRIVAFGRRCAQALMRYMHLHRKPENDGVRALFLSLDGLPLTRDGFEQIIKRIRRASGVKRLHAHLFRHTFAARYLLGGGDVFHLQKLLGHESLDMTRRYVELTKTQAIEGFDKFSPADRLTALEDRRFGNRRKKRQAA